MNYLLDTNIISEVRRGGRCDPAVARWFEGIDDSSLYLSVLVTGEIRKGVEIARRRNAPKARILDTWLRQVEVAFEGRILPVDAAVADAWGAMNAVRSTPVVDGLLAATAKVFNLTLVTRNQADVAGLGARVLNPFESAHPS